MTAGRITRHHDCNSSGAACTDIGKIADIAVSSSRIPNQVEDRLDPWFDRLTTLSTVEGESIDDSRSCVSGCRIRSGMTGRN
jgi:hypothetical protein